MQANQQKILNLFLPLKIKVRKLRPDFVRWIGVSEIIFDRTITANYLRQKRTEPLISLEKIRV